MGSDSSSLNRPPIGWISTHAPRVGSDAHLIHDKAHNVISTHAPRVGSDAGSTESGGGREISTHAPRVGSDHARCTTRRLLPHFNSRSPCGERHRCTRTTVSYILFQLTLPVWGATSTPNGVATRLEFQLTLPVWGATYHETRTTRAKNISTHAPRVGSDTVDMTWTITTCYFNSRSPCGERSATTKPGSSRRNFNSRSPCGERETVLQASKLLTISTHAPRVGSDRK